LNYELEGLTLQKAELKNDSLVYLFSNEFLIKGQKLQIENQTNSRFGGEFHERHLVNIHFF